MNPLASPNIHRCEEVILSGFPNINLGAHSASFLFVLSLAAQKPRRINVINEKWSKCSAVFKAPERPNKLNEVEAVKCYSNTI